MSLEQVADDITDEARARADEIRAEADQRAEEILVEAEADAEEIHEAKTEEVDRQISQQREQALSSAKLEAKQQRLEARRDVLTDVYEEIEDALIELPEAKREELTRSLLDAAAEEFDEGASGTVYGREDDKALIESILEDYNGFNYGGPHECLGGVVVESEQSRVRVNNTFDSILDSVWDEHLKELSTHLFDQ